ncbi:MAG: hypothetical protein CL838_07715 [Crocinitomicaceae bacterium]|nr:hypothetical protein [Crocinitomicaceae bacterium]
MEEKKKSKLPLIFNILLVIIVSYLAYEVSVLSQKNHAFKQEISEMIKENEEMNQIIINQDLVSEADGENLKENLKLLLFSYDSLEQNNSVAIDSINTQREKINNLMQEVDKLDKKSKRDWRKIYKLKKEAETLRNIMKGYIHTIDSLNTLNINLSNDLTEKTQKLSNVSKQNKKIIKQNEALQKQVAIGAVLQINNVLSSGIRIRSSGAQSETTRASKTNMIKTCFSIIENKLAQAGDKEIYIRILDSEGNLLNSPTPLTIINQQKEELKMSSKRTINYQNQNTDLCIFYEIENSIPAGNYIVEVYAEGFLIGETSIALR